MTAAAPPLGLLLAVPRVWTREAVNDAARHAAAQPHLLGCVCCGARADVRLVTVPNLDPMDPDGFTADGVPVTPADVCVTRVLCVIHARAAHRRLRPTPPSLRLVYMQPTTVARILNEAVAPRKSCGNNENSC